MDEVRKRLDKITKVWNNYIWKYRFVQDHVNFNSEVRTNYYGDILAYFNDTLELLKVNPSTDFKVSIFNSIGLTQIIFVHQDLIDELLHIFGLPKSLRNDKEPNRTIRNQLTGHPISRNPQKELVSSMFFGNDMSGYNIHYIIYAAKNNFSGEDIVHKIDDILSRHSTYLLKYTDQILKKMNSVLTFYRERLVTFKGFLTNGSDINLILEQTDQFFESAYKENYTFKREYQLWYHQHSKDHPRYAHCVNLFLKTLSFYIQEKIKDVDVIISTIMDIPVERESFEYPQISIVIGELSSVLDENNNDQLHYYLSKLMQRHPIYNVSYFQNKYSDRPDVQEELSNMELNYHSDRDYHASFEYIRYLLGDRDSLPVS